MKSAITTIFAAAVLAAPVAVFAQASNAPLTRAQVRADLIQLEKAGYHPEVASPTYPQDIQAAEARVAAQRAAETAYGSSTSGSSQAGGPVAE